MMETSLFRLLLLCCWLQAAMTKAYETCKIPINEERIAPLVSSNRNETAQIIDGGEVEKGSAPWMVSVQSTRYNSRMHFCGGTIIDRRWVVTTAKCVAGQYYKDLLIVAGEHDLELDENTEQFRCVLHTVIHPHYDSFTRENDIALLEIKPLIENNYVQAIKILGDPAAYEGESCLVLGWGSDKEGGPYTNVLSAATQTVYEREPCEQDYPNLIEEGMLCAANLPEAAGPCQGDWGGPLVCREDELWGIASWSAGCASTIHSTVYTNSTFFYDWIMDITDISHAGDHLHITD